MKFKKAATFVWLFMSVFAFNIFDTEPVHAGGYEKGIMWSGRYSGQGGAAVSSVQGAEGLYFNPAGLLANRIGQDASINISPTRASYEGPIVSDQVKLKSKDSLGWPFGLLYGNTLNEDWAFGVGAYASSGSEAKFEKVAFPGYTLTPDFKSVLAGVEIAAGGAYRVSQSVKVGLAWRALMTNAEMATAAKSGAALMAVQLNDLKDTQYNGVKLGVQYEPNETWGLGLTVRNETKANLKGTSTAQVDVGTGPLTVTGGAVTVKSYFPMQATIGGHWTIEPKAWRAYAEYVFTDYSRVRTLVIDGTTTLPIALGGTTSDIPDIEQRWKDMHNVRLAGEFLRSAWPVRFGYVWTSQVTPDGYARAVFIAPGQGHTLTLGTGSDFLDGNLKFNSALEYSWVTGNVGSAAQTATKTGDYTTTAYSLHLGTTYLF